MRFVLGTVAFLIAFSSIPASAALEARLEGNFEMIVKITDADDGSQGEVLRRTFKFTSLCPEGPCEKITLRREAPHGHSFSSVLRLVQPGKYRGTEHVSGPSLCGGDKKGSQTVRLSLSIIAEQDGLATMIEGRAKLKGHCGGESYFQKASLNGERS